MKIKLAREMIFLPKPYIKLMQEYEKILEENSPEKIEKANRLSLVTLGSMRYWLQFSDDAIDGAIERYGA